MKQKCDTFIQERLKPKYIKPFDKKNKKDMQLVDIYCKLASNKILFVEVYKDLRPNVISEDYEMKFARITIGEKGKFSLDYMRHTGQWWDITYMAGDTLEKCLKGIEELPYFIF